MRRKPRARRRAGRSGREGRARAPRGRSQRRPRRERQAAVKQAEAKVARAEAAEQQARAAWERAHDDLLDARRELTALKSQSESVRPAHVPPAPPAPPALVLTSAHVHDCPDASFLDSLDCARRRRRRDARRGPRQGARARVARRPLGAVRDDGARHPDAARPAALPRRQPEHAGDPRALRRGDEEPAAALLGRRTHLRDVRGGGARARRPRARAQGEDAGGEAHAPARLLRHRDGRDDPRHAVAGTAAGRPLFRL